MEGVRRVSGSRDQVLRAGSAKRLAPRKPERSEGDVWRRGPDKRRPFAGAAYCRGSASGGRRRTSGWRLRVSSELWSAARVVLPPWLEPRSAGREATVCAASRARRGSRSAAKATCGGEGRISAGRSPALPTAVGLPLVVGDEPAAGGFESLPSFGRGARSLREGSGGGARRGSEAWSGQRGGRSSQIGEPTAGGAATLNAQRAATCWRRGPDSNRR
jgi:hypothetical protein